MTLPNDNNGKNNPPSREDAGGAVRKRRTHKKSRQGCANCKLRSVKCDETKPSCKKCQSYNVICTYGSSKFSAENLSIPTAASFVVDLGGGGGGGGGKTPPPRTKKTVSVAVPRSPAAPLPISGSADEVYQLVPADIPLLEKFQKRTVWTLGTRATNHVYSERILPLAFSHPLLMHLVLALAAIHDLALTPPFPIPNTPPSPPSPSSTFSSSWPFSSLAPSPPRSEPRSLTYHWYHAISLLQRKLTRPILPAERDVLWVSAHMVSIGHLAHVEAQAAADAWPFRDDPSVSVSVSASFTPATDITESSLFSHLSRPSESAATTTTTTTPHSPNLAWLKLCDGQRILARLTQPTRRGATFQLPAQEMMCAIAKLMRHVKGDERDLEALSLLPDGFDDLFELSSSLAQFSSTRDSHNAASHDGIEMERAKDHEHDFDCAYECVYPCVANGTEQDKGNILRPAHNHDTPPKPIHPSPYYVPAIAIAELINSEINDHFSMKHIVFIRTFDDRFRKLLEQKDERALLILLYWYAKLCDRRVWWARKQAWIDGQAICRYLEQTWAAAGSQHSQTRLQLLAWPKMRLLAAIGKW
ncbi:hypothetical protein F5Y17DRAFT_255123 [Xylariaceae sp. FL0594]|nr:hypothetical protein F5Y17DRAFT_255123 [Xylariaceae sp. FL0594]